MTKADRQREKWMALAVAEARRGIRRGEGGPFGAVVVRKGALVALGHNRVVVSHDPTAHAEIVALRRAAKKLGRFHLPDCEIYTTCEPCPMCLAALHWARVRTFTYGCTSRDAAAIGFADAAVYASLRGRSVKGAPAGRPLFRSECLEVFAEWAGSKGKIRY